MARGPVRPFPAASLKEAAQLARAIREVNPSGFANRVLVAGKLGRTPASSAFRSLISAANRYGFVEGNYNTESLQLTQLGLSLAKPTNPGEELGALRRGFENVPLFVALLTHYTNGKLPSAEFMKNTLERSPFDLPAAYSEEAAAAFVQNSREVGYIRDLNGTEYVISDAGAPVQEEAGVSDERPVEQARPHPSPSVAASGGPAEATLRHVTPLLPAAAAKQKLQFFIAHGRTKGPVVKLQRILEQFNIPYIVAEEEPHEGRPISQKIRDTMESCTAAIFVFTPDEVLYNEKGEELYRPRENVIFELGAASLLYGRKIVIFKEKSVKFASDFQDLAYIEFEGDDVEAKSIELLRELIALGAVKLLPGD